MLILLTGPSGVGKDSLLAALKPLRPEAHFAITATTRAPRPGEKHAVDYYFLTQAEFDRMKAKGELLEHAEVYGQSKGVPKEPIRKALMEGKDVFFRTDVQGAHFIKTALPGTVTVFVKPPSTGELKRRLRERGGDDPHQAELRLRIAEAEMGSAADFDYQVVNDDLQRCAQEILSIVELERRREGREPVKLV